MLRRLKAAIDDHIFAPFRESEAPIGEVALGSSMGIFIGFTPTVGVQMYLVGVLWILFRYIFRLRFNLPIAIALVWISNPLTMVPMYYGFLVVGNAMLEIWQPGQAVVDFAHFKGALMTAHPDASWAEAMWHGLVGLLVSFGWPMLVGSLVIAIPLAISTYPLTFFGVQRYRKGLAEAEGVSFAEWKKEHIHKDGPPVS